MRASRKQQDEDWSIGQIRQRNHEKESQCLQVAYFFASHSVSGTAFHPIIRQGVAMWGSPVIRWFINVYNGLYLNPMNTIQFFAYHKPQLSRSYLHQLKLSFGGPTLYLPLYPSNNHYTNHWEFNFRNLNCRYIPIIYKAYIRPM